MWGPGSSAPSPNSWERGQAASFFGSQAPRPRPGMSPLLFKAIQLHQCTETALFDLNTVLFHPQPISFLEEQVRGKSNFKCTFLRSYFPCGFFHFKEYSLTTSTQGSFATNKPCSRPLWSSPLGLPVSNHDGHEARKAMKPTLDFLRCCPLDAHQRAFTAAYSHSPPGLESRASRRQSS